MLRLPLLLPLNRLELEGVLSAIAVARTGQVPAINPLRGCYAATMQQKKVTFARDSSRFFTKKTSSRYTQLYTPGSPPQTHMGIAFTPLPGGGDSHPHEFLVYRAFPYFFVSSTFEGLGVELMD